MKRLTRFQRLLAGSLALSALFWAMDFITGSAHPKTAKAAPPPTPVAQPLSTPEDVTGLVERLTRSDYTSMSAEIEQIPRDLFLPTPRVEETLGNLAEEAAAQVTALKAVEVADDAVGDRHKLVGVILGRTPLAVIDDQVLPLHAELDGYRLIGIFRDYVVLQDETNARQMLLKLQSRTEPAKADSPRKD